ncbi:MAG: hypothetical protein EAZ92_05260 [Candidatus Kapaibacterium sp.]|nr:MAG: hypothetical protein EAZ92_05260 [Candidatus Kapabacteria bacterium]
MERVLGRQTQSPYNIFNKKQLQKKQGKIGRFFTKFSFFFFRAGKVGRFAPVHNAQGKTHLVSGLAGVVNTKTTTKNKKAPLQKFRNEATRTKILAEDCSKRKIRSRRIVAKVFHNFFSQFLGVSSMKRFFSMSSIKAVMVGVIVSGMATACQNGSNNPIGGFLPSEENSTASTANAKAGGTAAQSDEERKAEQARKIAEFLAKPEVKEMSAGLEEIAQAVAVAVEDKALTQRIYEKCMEKFDGETNTLWMHLEADSKLKNNGGWNKRVDAELGKGRKNAVVKGLGNVDAAIKKFEKFMNAPVHLFWAFPQNWDKKTTPFVAFVPMDVDPEKRSSIPAFDGKGNRIDFGKDGALAQKRPVLVITVNERATLDGMVRESLVKGVSHDSKAQTQILDFTAKAPNKPTEDKIMPFVSGGSTSVRLNWVTVPAIADEDWWNGGTEWIYTFQIGGRNSAGFEQWWPYTNNNLGAYPSGGTFYPNTAHNLVPPGANDATLFVEFKYYEDDFTMGQYDIFDDWWGYHRWTATSSPTGIITLPPPGSNVTRYDPNYPSVPTVANYTWQ